MTPLPLAFAVLGLAAIADVLTTRAGLRSGRFYESNPLMRPFVTSTTRALAAKAVGLAVIGWGVSDLAPRRPGLALALVVGAVGLNAFHAWRNWRLLRAIRSHEARAAAVNARNARIYAENFHADFSVAPVALDHSIGDTEADIAELRAAARSLDGDFSRLSTIERGVVLDEIAPVTPEGRRYLRERLERRRDEREARFLTGCA